MKPLNISIPVVLSSEDVVESLVSCNHADICDFICNIDLSVADAGFTEQLIIRLIKSLRSDYDSSPEEFEAIFKEILESSGV